MITPRTLFRLVAGVGLIAFGFYNGFSLEYGFLSIFMLIGGVTLGGILLFPHVSGWIFDAVFSRMMLGGRLTEPPASTFDTVERHLEHNRKENATKLLQGLIKAYPKHPRAYAYLIELLDGEERREMLERAERSLKVQEFEDLKAGRLEK